MDDSENEGDVKETTIDLDSDDGPENDPGLYKVEKEDPPPAPSPGPFVLGIQHQGPSWATLPHTTRGETGGHFLRRRKWPEHQNGGRTSRARVSASTDTVWDFMPRHSSGRPRIPAAPPPGPAAHNGQTTSTQGTEATNYQEGPTDDRDERSERPLTDEDCSPVREGGGEEQGDQPDHQARSH